MFTEETLRGRIAKQDFGSWGWSTKASCVTRGNNSIFIPVTISSLLAYDDAKRNIPMANVQQRRDYGNTWGENM